MVFGYIKLVTGITYNKAVNKLQFLALYLNKLCGRSFHFQTVIFVQFQS